MSEQQQPQPQPFDAMLAALALAIGRAESLTARVPGTQTGARTSQALRGARRAVAALQAERAGGKTQ